MSVREGAQAVGTPATRRGAVGAETLSRFIWNLRFILESQALVEASRAQGYLKVLLPAVRARDFVERINIHSCRFILLFSVKNPRTTAPLHDQGIFKKILDMVVQQIKMEPIHIIREFENRCLRLIFT